MKARKRTPRTPREPRAPRGPRTPRLPRHFTVWNDNPVTRFDRDLEALRALGVSGRDFFSMFVRLSDTCVPPIEGTRRHYTPEAIERNILLRRELATVLAGLLASYVPSVRPLPANDALPEGVVRFDPRRVCRSARHGAPTRESTPPVPPQDPLDDPHGSAS